MELWECVNLTSAFSMLGSPCIQPDERKELTSYASAAYKNSTQVNGVTVGRVLVRYSTPGRLGRLIAVPQGTSISLSKMKRFMRNNLASDLYHDIDIVNCMPTLVCQMMASCGIPCPQLESYCNNRDAWIQVGWKRTAATCISGRVV